MVVAGTWEGDQSSGNDANGTSGGNRFVNAQNLESNTALHYAHENGDTQLIQLLLQYGANPNIRNMYGLVAVRGAATHSFADFANI